MKCRACSADLSVKMIDLGATPPSNAFNLSQDALEHHYPLRVWVCMACGLAQTDITLFKLDHDEVFAKEYPYYSSTSASWVEHARRYVEQMTNRLGLGPGSLAVEIGCNDGYLLQFMTTPCYGVEPTGAGDKAKAKGIEVFPKFFSSAFAENAAFIRGHADLVICNNVLAHVPDINDFVSGVSILLKPDGVATFEFPHLLNLIRDAQFDTIYHEHYSYLSLTAVVNIFHRRGLHVFDVEKLTTHGGSLRVYAQKADGQRKIRDSVPKLLAEESDLARAQTYDDFQQRVDLIKNDLLWFLLKAKRYGRKVAGFGAAAKANTFLNYAGIRADLIEYVVDETPAKQGKFMPGSRIPVLGHFPSTPDVIVVFPWNFRDEIVQKLRANPRLASADLVFAMPELEVLEPMKEMACA